MISCCFVREKALRDTQLLQTTLFSSASVNESTPIELWKTRSSSDHSKLSGENVDLLLNRTHRDREELQERYYRSILIPGVPW